MELQWLVMVNVVMMVAFPGWTHGLSFDLSGRTPKCLAEEIQANVLVLANYQVLADGANHHKVSVKVTSPYGNPLHSAEGVPSGQFGFTTSESGNYMACFWLPTTEEGPVLGMELDWKIGVAAKDWESVARKDKIEGVELELMKLQGAVEAIHENLVYLRERERDMRNVSEFTNTKVAWFGITSLMICLSAAGLQLWHLKSYFEKKKLI